MWASKYQPFMPLRDNKQLLNIQRKGESIGSQAFLNRSSKCFPEMQVSHFLSVSNIPYRHPVWLQGGRSSAHRDGGIHHLYEKHSYSHWAVWWMQRDTTSQMEMVKDWIFLLHQLLVFLRRLRNTKEPFKAGLSGIALEYGSNGPGFKSLYFSFDFFFST